MSTNQQDYQNFALPYHNTGFNAELAQQPRRGGSCCFFGCCFGCLGFFLLIAIAFFAFWYCLMSGGADLIVSEETTVITEPLKSDGKTVDFFQALKDKYEPVVPADENGFKDVLLAFGRGIFGDGDDADWQYLATCEALGVDPQVPPQEKVAFDDQNLDIVQVAAAKPHYFTPMVRQSEEDLLIKSSSDSMSFHDDLCEALGVRAASRFDKEGNIAEAWKDVLTYLRLVRTGEVTMLSDFDGHRDRDFSSFETKIFSTLPKWTPEQLKQAIQDLESLPDWPDRQMILTMCQFLLLDLLSATNDWDRLQTLIGEGMDSEQRQVLIAMLQFIAFDWNLVAKELNREVKAYGELMENVQGKSLEEQFELLGLHSEGIGDWTEKGLPGLLENHLRTTGDFPLFTSGRSKLAGFLAGEVVKMANGMFYQRLLTEESRCQGLRLALALELYHREHQKYPDTLDELGLPALPMNVLLEYEKRGAGYRIWNKVFELER